MESGNRKYKIVVTGTRGIPNIMGGVETHCENLYPYIVQAGYDVTVVRRSCYLQAQQKTREYKGIHLKDIYAPRKKSLEAIIHTILAVLYAKKAKADILHIHAIGPSLLVPFAKMLGLKVVVTHHGADYDRKKWNKAAKYMLRKGEKYAAKYADKLIVISSKIKKDIAEKYGRTDTELIYNGVPEAIRRTTTEYITSKGLASYKYILAVGRFVEEKGFDYLIDAYSELHPEGYKLVIAGDSDHPTEYSIQLKEKAKEKGIVLTGFVKGKPLEELMTHARLFVLPSYHEGLPISLLEAMSYGKDVLVSDIEANRLPELEETDIFKTGSTSSLKQSIEKKLQGGQNKNREYAMYKYNWQNIAAQTTDVYKTILKKQK